jgi:hypothetical protein
MVYLFEINNTVLHQKGLHLELKKSISDPCVSIHSVIINS